MFSVCEADRGKVTSSVTRRIHQWGKKTSHSVASVLKILRRWIYSRTFFTRRIFTYCTRCSVCQYALNFFPTIPGGGVRKKSPESMVENLHGRKNIPTHPIFSNNRIFFPPSFWHPPPFWRNIVAWSARGPPKLLAQYPETPAECSQMPRCTPRSMQGTHRVGISSL